MARNPSINYIENKFKIQYTSLLEDSAMKYSGKVNEELFDFSNKIFRLNRINIYPHSIRIFCIHDFGFDEVIAFDNGKGELEFNSNKPNNYDYRISYLNGLILRSDYDDDYEIALQEVYKEFPAIELE